jgi:hypothetical protein
LRPQPLCRSADELIRQLRRILTEGGSGNFLIAAAGHAFVQFAAERGSPHLHMEVTANASLPPQRRLDADALRRLERMGFLMREGSAHYSRAVEVEDEATLAHLAHQTVMILESIYGCDPRDPLAIDCELQRFQHPKNPELLAALFEYDRQLMRENWNAFCRAFLDAHLLVPVDDTHTALYLHDPDNRPVLPVCSDYDAILAVYPKGNAYTIMPGTDFVEWAQRNGVWPVMLNPGGPLVLELDRTQIGALATLPVPVPARR